MIDTKQLSRTGAGGSSDSPGSNDRLAESKAMLLKFRADTPEPQWSSYVLEQYIRSTLLMPGGSLDDVLRPLSEIMGAFQLPLSQTLSHFLKELVVVCFTQYRAEYARIQWPLLLNTISESPSQSQSYLALLAVPPDKMPDTLAQTIVRSLTGTPWEAESASLLEDVRQETH